MAKGPDRCNVGPHSVGWHVRTHDAQRAARCRVLIEGPDPPTRSMDLDLPLPEDSAAALGSLIPIRIAKARTKFPLPSAHARAGPAHQSTAVPLDLNQVDTLVCRNSEDRSGW